MSGEELPRKMVTLHSAGKNTRSYRFTLPEKICKFCNVGEDSILEVVAYSKDKIVIAVIRR